MKGNRRMLRNLFRYIERLRPVLRKDDGQALIETALSVLFFIFLIFGTTEFVRLAYAGIEVSNAAKAAVEYATQSSATSGDATGVQNAASAEAPNLTVTATLQPLSIICSDGSAYNTTSGCAAGTFAQTTVTVTTSATYNPLIHITGFPNTFTLKGRASQIVTD
jgi:Flp pilus assembly protein TadG